MSCLTRGASVGRHTLFPLWGALPITWIFEPILRSYIVTVGGQPTLDELDHAFDSIVTQPTAPRMLRLLVDLRIPTPPPPEMGQEALVRLGRYVPRIGRLEVFIVVAGSGHRPPGRPTSVTFGDKVTIDIFDDMAAAVTAMAMEGLD